MNSQQNVHSGRLGPGQFAQTHSAWYTLHVHESGTQPVTDKHEGQREKGKEGEKEAEVGSNMKKLEQAPSEETTTPFKSFGWLTL